MNKFITFLLLFPFIFIVNRTLAQQSQSQTASNNFNKVLYDTNARADILCGFCTLDGLKQSSTFKIFWDIEQKEYTYKSEILLKITPSMLEDISIVVIFGSWCDDSRMNVPRFMGILDFLKFPLERVNIIAVDKKKKVETMNLEEFKIEKVPTFIIYRNKIEIGRIIENPKLSLEADLLKILEN